MGVRFGSHCVRATLGAAAVCLSTHAAPADSQVVVKGTLYQDSTGAPVRGTMMLVDPATNAAVVHVVTDSLGGFELRARSGIYQIAAVRDGFTSTLSAPMTLANGERLTVRVPIATGDVTHQIGVTEHIRPDGSARDADASPSVLSAFKQRDALHAPGHRYDRRALEGSTATTLGEFLQRQGGLSIVDPSRGSTLRMSRSGSTGSSTQSAGSACHVGWFVDDHRMDLADGVDAATSSLAGLPLDDIEAVEVFRGLSEMPSELARPELRCGAIAIWTRRTLH